MGQWKTEAASMKERTTLYCKRKERCEKGRKFSQQIEKKLKITHKIEDKMKRNNMKTSCKVLVKDSNKLNHLNIYTYSTMCHK